MPIEQARESHLVDRGLTVIQPDPITKLKLDANIILNDFVFNTIDDFDVVWVITNIEGWWNTAESDLPSVEKGFGDGAYDTQGRYASRSLTVSGSFLVPHPNKVEEARDRLTKAANLVYSGGWLKTGNNPTRASFVRLAGAIEFETVNTRGRTNFTIPLRAADPIKYSWNAADPEGYEVVELPVKNAEAGLSGSTTVENLGNYPVPVYFEITGPVLSPATIYNRTTDELIIITQEVRGRLAEQLINKQLRFNVETLEDVATITTTNEHSFSVGDIVLISNVGGEFDGERVVSSVPTNTTFTFKGESADIFFVAQKKLENGVSELRTTTSHNFSPGDEIIISGVDAVFDGPHEIATTPSSNTFTFARTRIPPASVVSKILVANIATLTTANPHEFILGETVEVSGVDTNFNGSHVVTGIPSPTEFSYAATRTNAREVVNKSMSNDIVTLTTANAHGFVPEETVNISNVSFSINGGYTIVDTPTSTTFTYERPRITSKPVVLKSRSSNVATLATFNAHGFRVGEKVVIRDVGNNLDGTVTITEIASPNTFSYASSGDDLIASTVLAGASVKSKSREIKNRDLVANLATIVTHAQHGAFVGEQVTISGLGSTFNGTYEIVSVPSPTSFTYNKVSSNVPALDFGTEQEPGPDSPLENAFADLSGAIASSAVSPTGTATVSGSLPFTGATGTATAPDDIPQLPAAGRAIKPNDVRFTPGLELATAVLDADILEINTLNREVFFNGFPEGARSKVDVLADFIRLAPGENVLEFEDQGSPDGEGSLKIFYRSGWLT